MADYGTQPTIGRRGRGSSQGVRPNRAPGRRNTGGARRPNTQGGQKRPPNNPAALGAQGEALTNQEPEAYAQAILAQAKYNAGSGNLAQRYGEEILLPRLLNEYNLASWGKQNTSPKDFFKSNYGAGQLGHMVGRKGHRREVDEGFSSGSLEFNPNDPAYKTFVSNNEEGWIGNQLNSGAAGGVGTGPGDFNNYVNETFAPKLEQDFATQRGQGGIQDKNAWLATQGDAMHRARRFYAMRPNQMRTLAPVTPEGRYSWWS
jgi:hypothetical protein